MKYKNFEKQISESFLHDSAAVDTDALIASLGIPVALEPKKRAAWWMLTGLALLSLVAIGLYYFTNVPMSIQGSDVSSIMIGAGMNDNNNESSPVVAEYDESTNDKTSNKESNTIEVKANKEEVNAEVSEPIINDNSGIIFAKKNKVKETNTKYISKEKTVISEIAVSENFESSKYETPSNFALSTNADNVVKGEIDNINEESTVNNIGLNRVLEPLLPIDILESGVVSEEDSPGLKEPECPSFSYRIPWNIALLAEVGVMKPMKDLMNSGSTNSAFDLRERNESSKEAIQIGLHAKVSKGSNPLYVRGGAAYTRIAEQMSEEYDYIELDTMRGLISITTSMTGDTITAVYGDVVSETRYTGRSEKHYFLHLLDIPVAVGYELPIGGSFYAGAELGAQFNLRTSGSGLIFRDVNDYADLSEVTTKETKVGISYFGGFHFGKHLSKRSSIQLSARFRYYPSRFSTVDPSIEQRYNLAGLHAGYVFRF